MNWDEFAEQCRYRYVWVAIGGVPRGHGHPCSCCRAKPPDGCHCEERSCPLRSYVAAAADMESLEIPQPVR